MRFLLLSVLLLTSLTARAWWQDDWNFRKQLTVVISGGAFLGLVGTLVDVLRTITEDGTIYLDTKSGDTRPAESDVAPVHLAVNPVLPVVLKAEANIWIWR